MSEEYKKVFKIPSHQIGKTAESLYQIRRIAEQYNEAWAWCELIRSGSFKQFVLDNMENMRKAAEPNTNPKGLLGAANESSKEILQKLMVDLEIQTTFID